MPSVLDTHPPLHRIDVERFLAIEYELDPEPQSIELIDGVVVRRMSAGVHHWKAQFAIHEHFMISLANTAYAAFASAGIAVSRFSLPKPDVYILPRPQTWQEERDGFPATTALLAIEVSDTSRRFDLGRKRELYAGAGIPEYWVIDINRRRLVVHRVPERGTYRLVTTHDPGDPVAPQQVPDAAPFDVVAALAPVDAG